MGRKKIEPIVEFNESIKGEKWKVRFYTHKKFLRLYPNCVGITQYDHRRGYRAINFTTFSLNKDTIAHEVMHALLSYRDFSKKSYGKIEEDVCEEIGKSYNRLYKLTNAIYAKFKHRRRKAK